MVKLAEGAHWSRRSRTLPSGADVIYEQESDGIEVEVSLYGLKRYEEYGVRYYDWQIRVALSYNNKKTDSGASYDHEAKSLIDDYWEAERWAADGGLERREEEQAELFNNIVREVKSGKYPKKIAEDYGLHCYHSWGWKS